MKTKVKRGKVNSARLSLTVVQQNSNKSKNREDKYPRFIKAVLFKKIQVWLTSAQKCQKIAFFKIKHDSKKLFSPKVFIVKISKWYHLKALEILYKKVHSGQMLSWLQRVEKCGTK